MKKPLVIVISSMLLIVLFFSLISIKQPESSSPSKLPTPSLSTEKHVTDLYIQRVADSIKNYFSRAIEQNKIVGAAIAITRCDSTIYLGGFGKKNANLQGAINEETIFRIGSVSKGFAGILTGIHVEEGILDWDDKVVDHVPSFQLANTEYTKKITLSHVLSHTSGLPYHSFTNLIEEGLELPVIASKFKEIESIDEPGTIYSYQNAAFALSGKILEHVTRKSLGEVIQNKIFRPLGMLSASTNYEALVHASNIAQPHKKSHHNWKPVDINNKYYTNAIAAGGVNASITDMSKWMQLLLGHDPDIIKPETLQKVFRPIIEVSGHHHKYYQKWPGYIESSYGLGWRIHTFADESIDKITTMIHHGGYVNNYRSEIAIYPSEDLGICILFNSLTPIAGTCIPDLHKIIQEIIGSIDTYST